MEKLEISVSQTSGYHPQANGLRVESYSGYKMLFVGLCTITTMGKNVQNSFNAHTFYTGWLVWEV